MIGHWNTTQAQPMMISLPSTLDPRLSLLRGLQPQRSSRPVGLPSRHLPPTEALHCGLAGAPCSCAIPQTSILINHLPEWGWQAGGSFTSSSKSKPKPASSPVLPTAGRLSFFMHMLPHPPQYGAWNLPGGLFTSLVYLWLTYVYAHVSMLVCTRKV